MKLILLIEDDEKIRASLSLQLREAGYGVQGTASAEEAIDWLESSSGIAPDLYLLDIRLPGMSGVDVVRWLAARGPLPPVIIFSGEASITEAVEALRLGVYDVIEKPFRRERLLKTIHNCLAQADLQDEVALLRRELDRGATILGHSAAIERLRGAIRRVSATSSRVLVRGESGSGKELVAAAIHRQSERRDKPFVKLNCAAIPVHLIESELFGHIRGAFTDARATRPGLFEEANGGTIFLDEIGDMDLSLQSRLLRVLEDGRVRRIGETQDRAIDVRVIAATHRDLEDMVRERTFRDDLYFRVSSVSIDVPPLRERQADIALLFVHFLETLCIRNRRRALTVTPEAIRQLEQYRWPGNVRELRNVAEQLSVFGADPVTVDQLPSSVFSADPEAGIEVLRISHGAPVMSLKAFKTETEREYIEAILRRTNWNFSQAARLLQIQRTFLHQKVKALGIRRPAGADVEQDDA